jgi:GNAT superfamily N-acetyltransferase
MQYKQEFLLDVKDEVVLLIQDHFDEVYPARKVFELDMDWDLYSQLENLGLLKIFTARDDGSLVGYLFVVLSPNLHSKGSMLACDDGLYVAKSHRGKSVAKDLVCFTEHCLKEDGVKVFHIVGTTEKPIDSLVKRMGYVKVETKFQKVL